MDPTREQLCLSLTRAEFLLEIGNTLEGRITQVCPHSQLWSKPRQLWQTLFKYTEFIVLLGCNLHLVCTFS